MTNLHVATGASHQPQQASIAYAPIYDLFLDLPHPMASRGNDPAKLIGPHPTVASSRDPITEELHDGESIAKVSRYAFPDHDDSSRCSSPSSSVASPLGGGGGTAPAELNAHDVHSHMFPRSTYHTFDLRLSRTGARVHGHVRRYLPPHRDAGSRVDVGRRCVRAMVILTRSAGGELFWSSTLETIEAVCLHHEAPASARGGGDGELQPYAFLFELHERHARLWQRWHDRCDDFDGGDVDDGDAYDLKQQLRMRTIKVRGVEFGHSGVVDDDEHDHDNDNEHESQHQQHQRQRRPLYGKDYVRFQIPASLQPMHAGLHSAKVEDAESPILPLLRCLRSTHFLRLLSALLCEKRVILISSDVARLSACVRGAASALAQGLLVWQHVLVPVLPPHLMKYLANPAPYLIGLPQMYTKNLEMIPGVGDVLCVDIDVNAIWTYHVADTESSFPDLLSRVGVGVETTTDGGGGGGGATNGGKGPSPSTAAEKLAQNLVMILKADKKLWAKRPRSATSGESVFSFSPPASPSSSWQKQQQQASQAPVNGSNSGESGFAIPSTKERPTLTNKMKSGFSVIASRCSIVRKERSKQMSRGGKAPAGQLASAFHRESFYGMMVRTGAKGGGTCLSDDNDDSTAPSASEASGGFDGSLVDELSTNAASPSVASDHAGPGENVAGEESIRIALVSFFLALFGDMGMYLSESNGDLVLDRTKFLLLKKMHGDGEQSAMYKVLSKLTLTETFRLFVRMRIRELENRSDSDSVEESFTTYMPLFLRCERHLLMKGMNVTNPNIPQVVKMIAESQGSLHGAVSASERVRNRAIALTSKKQSFDEAFLYELVKLAEDCHDVSGVLPHVMGVIWTRLQEAAAQGGQSVGGRSSSSSLSSRTHWRCALFTLHLLRSVLLHGPITALPQASDNMDLIRLLMMTYVSSPGGGRGGSSEGDREVRELAECIYDLLLDRALFFSQRRHCAGRKMHSATLRNQAKKEPPWQNYLIEKLPITRVRFGQIHSLMRPPVIVVPQYSSACTNKKESQEDVDESSAEQSSLDGSDDLHMNSEASTDLHPSQCNDHEYDVECLATAMPKELAMMLASFNSAMELPTSTNENFSTTCVHAVKDSSLVISSIDGPGTSSA